MPLWGGVDDEGVVKVAVSSSVIHFIRHFSLLHSFIHYSSLYHSSFLSFVFFHFFFFHSFFFYSSIHPSFFFYFSSHLFSIFHSSSFQGLLPLLLLFFPLYRRSPGKKEVFEVTVWEVLEAQTPWTAPHNPHQSRYVVVFQSSHDF